MVLSDLITVDRSVRTPLLWLFLIFMFVDYAGYGYYVFYLTFFYLFYHKVFRLIDGMFFLLLVWGILYGLINYYHSGIFGYSQVFVFMINFPMLYLAGKYIVLYNTSKGLFVILFSLALSLAIISIISVFQDVADNGFLVAAWGRDIPLIGIHNAEGVISATGISSRLMPLSFSIVVLLFPLDIRKKLIIVASSLLAIFCGFRLQSRTMIVGLASIFLLITMWNWNFLSRRQKCILLVGLFLVVCSILWVLSQYSDELAILDRFQDDEIESGGGRSYRLAIVASLMPSYPFGGMGTGIPYAHNMWFDCARLTGFFPFFLLSLFSLRFAFQTLHLLRDRNQNMTLRNILMILSFAILVVSCSEPVLEGIPMVFALLCFLAGVVESIKS